MITLKKYEIELFSSLLDSLVSATDLERDEVEMVNKMYEFVKQLRENQKGEMQVE